MVRYCNTCKTNKSDIEFSPTSNYCRSCVTARKARSIAIKNGTAIGMPRGRPKKIIVAESVMNQSAVMSDKQRFGAMMQTISMNLRSENIDDLLVEARSAITRSALEIKHNSITSITMSIQSPKCITMEELNKFIHDEEYYICYNAEKEQWGDCRGKLLKPYLSSMSSEEYTKWEIHVLVDNNIGNELLNRGFRTLCPFPPKV